MAEAKRDWVERVLKIPMGVVAGPPADLLAVWRDAKEAVDVRLEALASKLREFDDPDLDRIADFGLYGIGAKEGVALNKAMFDYGRAAPAAREGAGASVRRSVELYRATLGTKLVSLIDHNPVDVEIGLQKTIGGALDRIEALVGP